MDNRIKKELDSITKAKIPNTINSLKRDFISLGVKPGAVIIMHSSLSKIGWIAGGSVAVIDAIMDVLTPEGTLVMPTCTGSNTEPSKCQNPPVPESWWSIIRENTPAFHPDKTPTRGMGKIPETFRKYPGVLRSNHPVSSFSAWGKHARFVTDNHQLESDLGEGSPLARLYDLNGEILLLGVPHTNNTMLHLAEYRCDYPDKTFIEQGAAVFRNNKREWITWKEMDNFSDDFDELGLAYEQSIGYQPKKVGQAEACLLPIREMVDFAQNWMVKNRDKS